MRSRPLLAVLAGLALVVGLVGCGDDGDGEEADGGAPTDAAGPALGEHWHTAYAITACGTTLAPAEDRGADVLGIHTHGDGLIHTHPFLAQAAEAGATLGVFLDQIGVTVNDRGGLDLVADDAPECAGGVRVGQWDAAADAATGEAPDRVITEDIDQIVLGPDRGALSIVIGPDDDPIPAPEAATDICALAAVDGPLDPVEGSGGEDAC